jgi:transcriptional regulator GlxA family with amidase domain
MIRAALLSLDGCYVSALGGFADVLQVANAHLRMRDGEQGQRFEWHFVSLNGESVTCSNGLRLSTERLGANWDLVFIPSLFYGGAKAFDGTLKACATFIPWLQRQWEAGAVLAANCTGTFLLAETGLLDGREATTTWWLEQQFRERYPRPKLRMQPVLTEVDRLSCAGASASFLLQAVKMVERFAGKSIATQCAGSMLIDVSQTQQLPYLSLLAERDHADPLVHRAQQWLLKHLAKPVRLEALVDHLSVSERTLIRRFRDALDLSPMMYLQNLRMDAARAMLTGADLPVQQIAMLVGYSDTSSFTRLFRTRVGLSPTEYRTRFRSSTNIE